MLLKPNSIRSWVAILLLALLFCAQSSNAQPSPETKSKNRVNLFAMSLEQVLDIRVHGAQSENTHQEGIHSVSEREFARVLHKIDVRRTSKAIRRDNTVLMIDGYSVGTFSSLLDLKPYSRYFRDKLARVELYLGESALLLSDGNSKTVVNLITKDSSEEASK